MDFKDLLGKLLYCPIKFKNIRDIKKLYKINKTSNNKVEEINIGKNEKTLIISPHVDDETIGIGGFLLNNKENNNNVDLLYMTDSGGSLGKGTKEVKITRKEEAFKLQELLKLNKVIILNVENNNDEGYNEFAFEELEKILNMGNYKNIFIVSPFDSHVEHRWVNKILGNILKVNNFKYDIYLYEVSNLLPFGLVNFYSSIDVNEKSKLYTIFESQKYTMDFDIFNQLNKYKGKLIGIENGVELFCKLNSTDYLNIINVVEDYNIQEILPYRIGNHRSFYKVINNEKIAQEKYEKIEMLI